MIGIWILEFTAKRSMPPSADQISNVKNILQTYKTQVRVIVAKHKTVVKKIAQEFDRRKVEKLKVALKM